MIWALPGGYCGTGTENSPPKAISIWGIRPLEDRQPAKNPIASILNESARRIGGEWAGGEFGLPKMVLISGMALWWLVPGLLITGAVVIQKEKTEREAE